MVFVKNSERKGSQEDGHLRISIVTCALGTQKRSSFLCHKVDSGVSRIRWGRFKGWKDAISIRGNVGLDKNMPH